MLIYKITFVNTLLNYITTLITKVIIIVTNYSNFMIASTNNFLVK
jgi:hypothetical protein